MLKNQEEYRDPGADYYEEQCRQLAIKDLKRKVRKLGLKVVPIEASPADAQPRVDINPPDQGGDFLDPTERPFCAKTRLY